MITEIEYDPLAHMRPSYFEIMGAQGLKWPDAIGELIDNGFDASANRVIIQFGPGRVVTVSDDGDGCDDIEKMFSLGSHYVPRGKLHTRIGRWGVGLKDTATWLWGITEITSVTDTGWVARGLINWPVYTQQPDRTLKWRKWPAEKADSKGTMISFKNIERRFPDFNLIASELGYLFSPGLQQGKQIVLAHGAQRRTLRAWKLPPFDGASITEEFVVNGRRAILMAGVVAEGYPNERKGYSIFFDKRIIKNTTAWANGGQSLARFCATIELDHHWVLGKNKSDIKETQLDELELEVFKRCELLIARAAKQSSKLKNTKLNQNIKQILQATLKGSNRSDDGEKETRGKGTQHETIEPKHTGRIRRPKKTRHGGAGMAKISAIDFDWENAGLKNPYGKADINKNQCMVWLNEDHPFLKYLKEVENSEAIATLCWVVAVEANQKIDGNQLRLITKGENVIDSLTLILNGYDKATEKQREKAII